MKKQLTLAQKAVLELVKIGIETSKGDLDFSALTLDDWKEVVKESKAQTVALLCFDACERIKDIIPKQVYNVWFNLATKILINNTYVLNSQAELDGILCAENLNYIILKGSAAASYYPDPDKRSFGDVDFLISPVQQKQVEDKLISCGYTMELEQHERHRVFKKPNVHLEMHFEVAGLPDGYAGEILRDYLKNAQVEFTTDNAKKFHNPIPENHGVIILLHTAHHMTGEGIGIRHLCDWACFVNKTYSESFWEDTLLPLFRKCGLLEFAAAITKTCSLYFGTECPDFARHIDDDLCFNIIEDIFALGNFGRKDKARSIGGGMLSKKGKKHGRISNLFSTVCNSVHYMYPITNKYPILFPFMFVWRVLKYLGPMLVGKKPSIFKASALANERKSIYNQFRLFVTEEEN